MMKRKLLTLVLGSFLLASPALAQQKTVTGTVTSELGNPLPGVQVVVKGTTTGTLTNNDGAYSVRAAVGQVLQYRLIGNAPVERTVGAENVINVSLKKVVASLDAMVVTALGQTASQRSLGTSQQAVQGPEIAQTQRENFINSLQGRVAGVDVTSSSGVPGASTTITIRGVSSVSSSNQPLIIVDGLPLDNKTLATGVLASDAPGSLTAFNNRGVDFTNRAADLNPEDIESLVVLKGPEASALYGIDAANGAIVITTKRGQANGGFSYSNSYRIESTNARPEVQRVYSPTSISGGALGAFSYFGTPYAAGTTFYDNISGFFRSAVTQKHNISFSGAAPDGRINYRVAASTDKQQGVIPGADYQRTNITAASQAQVLNWLKTDVSMSYSKADNNQGFKGTGGPLLGLLLWPATDNAKDYLSAAGTRRRVTALATASEVDNPYFNVNKNRLNSSTGRYILNFGLVLTPFNWGELKTNIGVDNYTNSNLLLRHPESAYGYTYNGVLDVADDMTRNLSAQTILNVFPKTIGKSFTVSGLVGHSVADYYSNTDALKGQDFLDPNFVSVNNTNLRTNRTTLSQRRLVSAFGQATLEYRKYLYLNVTGRNDWTSTIPEGSNSFFYPSVSMSYVFSDAFPKLGKYMTGKLRGAYAAVGKDARPYAYKTSLEYKTTTNGGYGYGFYGPNLKLMPEFAKSYEFGTELTFLDNRLGLDVTAYRKRTENQIVNDIRGSYATGFILFNLNGASTQNEGLEITLKGTPILKRDYSWDFLVNFAKGRSKVLALPNALPESYMSDTWLYGNVRSGVMPGLSTMSLTGLYYLRNTAGDILIDPTTGLPLRSATFIDHGYDRQSDFTIGVSNTFKFKNLSLDFLIDIRKGGDIFNATQHYLTTVGLATSTLDRETPRIIKGVLRDGKENSTTPTPNNIVVVPAVQTAYYTSMSEELFIEKNINWIRLKDVTLRYQLPKGWLWNAKNASVFLTGTDLYLKTNYTGLDPIVNGNSAAVGGAGGAGIDFGNFPIPRGVSFGLKVGF